MAEPQVRDGLWQVGRNTCKLIVIQEELVQVLELAEYVLADLVRVELVVKQYNPDQVSSVVKHPVLNACDLVPLQVDVLNM